MKLTHKIALAGALAASAVTPAFAEVAQPTTTEATAYITAGAATLLAVIGAKYAPAAAVFIAKWVKSVIGR